MGAFGRNEPQLGLLKRAKINQVELPAMEADFFHLAVYSNVDFCLDITGFAA